MVERSFVPFEHLYAEPSRNGLTRPKRVRGTGYKMINMGEIFAYNRINDPPMELVPMNAKEMVDFRVEPGDLLFARQSLVAAGAGKCSIVIKAPELTTFESHLIRVRLDEQKADPLFYFYYFSSPEGKGNVQSLVMQVAAAGIRGSELAKLRVPYYPLPVQRKIASILSAYDDLIENNTRRIEILEEMARSIYREWFVNFRFPGYEKVKMVDSELGPIPEGWEVKRLFDVCERVDYGYTASATQEEVGPKFLRITDIVPYTINWDSVPYCVISPSNLVKFRLLEGDIVIARTGATTGYAKRIGKRGPESVFASYLVRLRVSSCVSNLYIGLLVESEDYKRFIKANLGGAAQPQANARVLTSIPVIIPTCDLQVRFDQLVNDYLYYREILFEKNTVLRRTRNFLLPKLITGELDVSEADINLGASN